MHSSRGFTLIELSIVLVIIGLIVGGVLTGRDLIRAAEVRATVAQIEKYNTAVNTFRIKYNGLPGDLPNATIFGFAFNGNGDGCITDCTFQPLGSSGTLTSFTLPNSEGLGEITAFWNQLSTASLIDGSYDGSGVMDANTIGNTLPRIKLNSTVGLLPYFGVTPDTNYYQMVVYSDTGGGEILPYYYPRGTVSPESAYAIDKKMDDGFPSTGTVRASDSQQDGFFDQMYDSTRSGAFPPLPITYDGQYCAYVPAGENAYIYNLKDNTAVCMMQFRFMGNGG